jgi:hypothetical protein
MVPVLNLTLALAACTASYALLHEVNTEKENNGYVVLKTSREIGWWRGGKEASLRPPPPLYTAGFSGQI